MNDPQTIVTSAAMLVMVRKIVRCGCVTRVGCARKTNSTVNGFGQIQ